MLGLPPFSRRFPRRTTVLCLVSLLLGLVLAGPSDLRAQGTDSLEQRGAEPLYRVRTTADTVLVGPLVSESETDLVIDTHEHGEVTVSRDDIRRMDEVDSGQGREEASWYRNPHPTRYFFATNAFGPSGGTGYYQNVWFLLLSSVHYGVTDHLSVGAGTSPIGVPASLADGSALPVWGRAELSVPSPQKYVHLGGGVLFGRLLGDERATGGLLYGSGTVGTRDHNVTLSVGYRHTGGDLANTPRITVSGMTRIRRSFYLLSENRFFLTRRDRHLVSVGVRWTSEHGAVDVAWFRDLSSPRTLLAGIPWLGITLPFGR